MIQVRKVAVLADDFNNLYFDDYIIAEGYWLNTDKSHERNFIWNFLNKRLIKK